MPRSLSLYFARHSSFARLERYRVHVVWHRFRDLVETDNRIQRVRGGSAQIECPSIIHTILAGHYLWRKSIVPSQNETWAGAY